MKIPGGSRRPLSKNALAVKRVQWGAHSFRAQGKEVEAEMIEEMVGQEVGLTDDDIFMLVVLRRLRDRNVPLDSMAGGQDGGTIIPPDAIEHFRAQGLRRRATSIQATWPRTPWRHSLSQIGHGATRSFRFARARLLVAENRTAGPLLAPAALVVPVAL